MKKIVRTLSRAIESTGVTILKRWIHRGHYRFEIHTPKGETHVITAAGSPKIEEHTVAAVVRDIRRLM